MEHLISIPKAEHIRLLNIEKRARLVYDSTRADKIGRTIFWILNGRYPNNSKFRRPSIYIPQEAKNESNV